MDKIHFSKDTHTKATKKFLLNTYTSTHENVSVQIHFGMKISVPVATGDTLRYHKSRSGNHFLELRLLPITLCWDTPLTGEQKQRIYKEPKTESFIWPTPFIPLFLQGMCHPDGRGCCLLVLVNIKQKWRTIHPGDSHPPPSLYFLPPNLTTHRYHPLTPAVPQPHLNRKKSPPKETEYRKRERIEDKKNLVYL